MNDQVTTSHFQAEDGVDIAWHELGEGRPTILIHGYFSTAEINWIKYGHAGLLAAAGRRVIMPDLRGHGKSGKPHDPAAYPPDVLTTDGLALFDALGIDPHGRDYDIAGYSLGARTLLRMMIAGIRPRRAVLCGMGYDGIVDTGDRGGYFRRVLSNLGSFRQGSAEWMTEAFLKTSGGDPKALLGILDTFVDTPVEALAGVDVPIMVVMGRNDDEQGSGEELAEALPDAQFRQIPGNHMNAVTRRDLGQAILDYLES